MGFPTVIDNTMRKDWVRCPQFFKRRHIEGLAEKEPSVHLHFGGAFARGLEIARTKFFLEGCPATEAIEAGIAAGCAFYGEFATPADSYKTKARLVGALRYYFTQWPLETETIVPIKDGIEYRFCFELPGLHHPDTGEVLKCGGRFDLLGMQNDVPMVCDEKTTSRLGDSWYNQWDLNAQMTGYAWAAKLATGHTGPIGVQVRGVSILKNDYGHAEVNMMRTDWLIGEWYAQLYMDIRNMVAAYKRNEYAKAFSDACYSYARDCEYKRLCMSMNPERLLGEYEVRVWNPMAAGEA